MNAFLVQIFDWAEPSGEGLLWALNAGTAAAMFAAVVLVVDVVSRRWLSAGQKNLLWGLVLVRMLIPAAPASFLSVQNLLDPVVPYLIPAEVVESPPENELPEAAAAVPASALELVAAGEPKRPTRGRMAGKPTGCFWPTCWCWLPGRRASCWCSVGPRSSMFVFRGG